MTDTDLTATLLTNVAKLPAGTFSVRVTSGPEAGQSITLDGSQPGRVLVGQSPACALRLSDRRVSRRHLALELVGARLRLTDLESTNGTEVNDLSVLETWLGGGERIRVGTTLLEVERHPDGENPEVPYASGFGRFLGQSREVRRLYPLCDRIARARVPVVIEGETGTGKEVLAEALHEEGPFSAGPFVVFDCTAVPPSLVEAELFGHEKGAFTGAIASRKGVFEQAHGGTLLIDEIGDLELSLQPKLLRALERGEVRRVGGDRFVKAEVRVLSATRRDLDAAVAAGRFRDDLYHRLAVARIELPPLRDRQGDVTVLARHFWHELGGAGEPSSDLLARWEAWRWPGNVRELRNAVARAIALGEELAVPERAPEAQKGAGGALLERLAGGGHSFTRARKILLDEFERRWVERVLDEHGGNVSRAAAASGIARRHFQRIRARLGDGSE